MIFSMILVGFSFGCVGIGVVGLLVGYVYQQTPTPLTEADEIGYRINILEAYARSRQ